MNSSVFKQKLMSIMTDNKFDRRLPKRVKGKLDHKGLWRVGIGAKNVFSSKQSRKNKEYNVVLLVDLSGSMEGSKYVAARGITAYMASVFSAIGVNFAVIGFNSRITEFKSFAKTNFHVPKDLPKMVEAMDHSLYECGPCNHDYSALVKAYEAFPKKAKGKIVVYMSDGNPECSAGYGGDRKCSYAPEESEEFYVPENIGKLISSHTDVMTVGVGIIVFGHLKRIMKDVLEVNNLGEFQKKVMGWLESKIKRG